MVGKILGHYEVLEPLGAGGMGKVYRARDTKLERDVAIKVLPHELAADPDRLARFEREAKLLAALNHSNIGAIHGLEEADGVHFLVLELIDGETADSRFLAFAERVVEVDSGSVHLVTTHEGQDLSGTFSPDDRLLYVMSDRTGEATEIFAIPVEGEGGGGKVTRITRGGASFGFVDPDNQYLYYSDEGSAPSIWRFPLPAVSRS